MHCEYCNITFYELAEARRHMLTISHIREKRNFDLSTAKCVERMKQAKLHPKDFHDLTKVLNIHSGSDINALDSSNFFKITKQYESMITCELIRTLNLGVKDYYVNALPPEVREPFIRAIEKQLDRN